MKEEVLHRDRGFNNPYTEGHEILIPCTLLLRRESKMLKRNDEDGKAGSKLRTWF